jgi:hypothetical protein
LRISLLCLLLAVSLLATSCLSIPDLGGGEKTLRQLDALVDTSAPGRACSTISYTVFLSDGVTESFTLSASIDLVIRSASDANCEYSYEVLNPIGSESFKSTVSERIEGTAAELAAALVRLAPFIGESGAISLSTLSLSEGFLKEHEIKRTGDTYRLTAEVKDGAIEDVLGFAAPGIKDLAVSVIFGDERVLSLSLAFREAGSGAVIAVETVFAYTV